MPAVLQEDPADWSRMTLYRKPAPYQIIRSFSEIGHGMPVLSDSEL